MSSYQPLIPTGTVNLSVDYQNIQGNFQQLDTSFGVGHLPFSNGTGQNGYHTNIAMVPAQSGTNPPTLPTAISGYGQLTSATINDGVNTDQALYWLSGGGKRTQLTGNFQTYATTNGVTFLPGGLILQWGLVPLISGNVTVTFATSPNNMNFPNNLFNIQVSRQAYQNSETDSKFQYWVNQFSTTSFRIVSTDGHSWAYWWMAIGN